MCMCISMKIHMTHCVEFIYVFIQLYLAPVSICTYLEVVLAYVCLYPCASMCVYLCVCMFVRVYARVQCVCVCVCVCVHALKERVYMSASVRGVFLCMCVWRCVGKTGVTADRDKIEFRMFNSGSIFNITLREELFSLPKKIPTMHSFPGFMALVTWVEFLGEKLKDTIPLVCVCAIIFAYQFFIL